MHRDRSGRDIDRGITDAKIDFDPASGCGDGDTPHPSLDLDGRKQFARRADQPTFLDVLGVNAEPQLVAAGRYRHLQRRYVWQRTEYPRRTLGLKRDLRDDRVAITLLDAYIADLGGHDQCGHICCIQGACPGHFARSHRRVG